MTHKDFRKLHPFIGIDMCECGLCIVGTGAHHMHLDLGGCERVLKDPKKYLEIFENGEYKASFDKICAPALLKRREMFGGLYDDKGTKPKGGSDD